MGMESMVLIPEQPTHATKGITILQAQHNEPVSLGENGMAHLLSAHHVRAKEQY